MNVVYSLSASSSDLSTCLVLSGFNVFAKSDLQANKYDCFSCIPLFLKHEITHMAHDVPKLCFIFEKEGILQKT